MNADKVIELGKSIKQPLWTPFSTDEWVVFLIIIGLSVLGIFLSTANLKQHFYSYVLGRMLIIIVFFISLFFAFFKYADCRIAYDDDINKWRNTIAKSYIDNLPTEHLEIEYIKINPESSNKTEGVSYWNSRYTKSNKIEKTSLTISYNDGKTIVTRNNKYIVNKNLSNGEKPYIEFQRLDVNLGHGVNKGEYNAIVYLPNNYSFVNTK